MKHLLLLMGVLLTANGCGSKNERDPSMPGDDPPLRGGKTQRALELEEDSAPPPKKADAPIEGDLSTARIVKKVLPAR